MNEHLTLFLKKVNVIRYLSEETDLCSREIAYIVDSETEIIECYIQDLLSSYKVISNLERLDKERRDDIGRE